MTGTIALLMVSLGVFLALKATQSVQPNCPDGKERVVCGSSCPPTCDNLKPKCPPKCVPGCFCKTGTVDNGLGVCVETEKCKLCSGNTTYRPCVNPCAKLSIKCLIVCLTNCTCKADYVQLPGSDRCVLPQDLPKSGSNN